MPDQANRLRLLMRGGAREAALRPQAAAPQLVVVASGKGGVGTTTAAVNLAASLARDGRRTVLVDADLGRADATRLCRVDDVYTVADVLVGRRSVHETLVRGPAGVQVLPGAWAAGAASDCEPDSQQRLLDELARLGPHADYIVVDAGSSLDRFVRRFWQAADRVLVVTSPEAASVTNAYAAIKLLAASRRAPLETLVNLAGSAEAAAEISQRLSRACRRFLGIDVEPGGYLPFDPLVVAAGRARTPFVLAHAAAPASEQLERLASRWTAAEAKQNFGRIDSTRKPLATDK